jgi:hypothetical protein
MVPFAALQADAAMLVQSAYRIVHHALALITGHHHNNEVPQT